MILISNIRISYFRSIHKVTINRLTSINVLSGKNDTGKSNFLRALNLFFNGNVDWQVPINFYRDFSALRLQQVRRDSIKGKQFISVRLTFIRPESYSGSLPKKFHVTRTWHRDSPIYTETNNLETLANSDKLPSSLETAKRFLSIFLNRIHFEYVPAIKDRQYYEHLLSRLQSTLLSLPTESDESISQVAKSLADHIQGRIIDLQQDFERATGLPSSVEPPDEFADLFQAFRVTTLSGSNNIPLSLRGDGIQARYIPSALNYISNSSSDFFIWGFEEPENSLEYNLVTELAEDCTEIYSKSAQIFITTHSPAFTAIRDNKVACFRVFTKEGNTAAAQVWPRSPDPKHRSALNQDMGLHMLHEKFHEQFIEHKKLSDYLEQRNNELGDEITQFQLPVILTEGSSDVSILSSAWGKLRPDRTMPFLIRVADPADGVPAISAGGVGSLAKMIESIHPRDERKVIAIFDKDKAGLDEFRTLSNFSAWNDRDDVKCHINGLAFAVLLPTPAGRENYDQNQALSIEFMFPDNALLTRTGDNRGLNLSLPTIQAVILNGRNIPLDARQASQLPDQILPDFASIQVIAGGKTVFAEEVVPDLAPQDFASFEPLLITLDSIIDS